MKIYSMLAGTLVLLATTPGETRAQGVHLPADPADYTYNLQKPDSTPNRAGEPIPSELMQPTLNLWGVDIMLSNGGFGLGAFYRRQFTEDLFGSLTFSISGAKDDREVEFYDPITGGTFVPGKLNRFLVLPLLAGVHYRLFREDITDTFRPYVNAALGPTMVYSMPFVELKENPLNPSGPPQATEVEFFRSIGMGQAHYTLGTYIGAGAFFGSDASSVFGVNIRYYFIYLLGDGVPSLYDTRTGEVTSTKKDFGGFFITLNVGMGF